MPYTELYKEYYKDKTPGKTTYNSMYLQRIEGFSTIILDFDIADFPAFVIITPEIHNLTSMIYLENAHIIDNIHLLPTSAINHFFRRSLIEEVYQTLDIERVHSTRQEIAKVLEGKKAGKRARLEGMIAKYSRLIDTDEMPVRTCGDIRKLYDEFCLSEVIEEDKTNMPDGVLFREGPVSVFGKGDKEIHKGLFPEERIISAMDNALRILWDDRIELLIRISAFHYFMGYIHPFYDGNGRIARFISSHLLSANLNMLLGVRLSYTIKTHLEEYYSLFKSGNNPKNRGDLTRFVEGFLAILLQAQKNLAQALQTRKDRFHYYYACANQLSNDENWISISDILLQSTLFGDEGLGETDLATILNVSRTTIHKTIASDKYSDLFVVTKQGKKKLLGLNIELLEERVKSSLAMDNCL